MSNKEPQNQDKTTEEAAVDKRRRFIKGAGVAAPVVLTLSSPSVFGAFCRSEIMSGNESHMGTGSCVLGENRNYWKNPANRSEWPLGFDYGTLKQDPPSTLDCSNNSFQNGTRFRDIFGGQSSNGFMRIILCDSAPLLRESYYVAAALNAKKYPNYPLRPGDVMDLWKNPVSFLPPGYADDVAFIASTLKTAP